MTDELSEGKGPSGLTTKKAAVLDRLRERFGEDRDAELGDIEGVALLEMLLRPIEGSETQTGKRPSGDNEPAATGFSKASLKALRQERRRLRGAADAADLDDSEAGVLIPGADATGTMTFGALLDELPTLRENFGEWLSSVDEEFTPDSSSLEELEKLRQSAEYRLKLLKVMSNETQRELDRLIIAIRARTADALD